MNDIEYLKKYLSKEKLDEGIKKLISGEPIQYIIGDVNFYGNKIKVNKNVLIPRFETEELVEKTIKYAKEYFDKKIDVIDLGTGSGCIAITLKKELDCNMDALDISDKALEVAKENAIINNVDINFIESDMTKPLSKKYDLIISNPPYIAYDEEIMDIVKNNEPHTALYASDNGTYFYKKIIDNVKYNLKEKYFIAFEIGCNQANIIKEYAYNTLENIDVSIEKDMSNRDRFIFIKTN